MYSPRWFREERLEVLQGAVDRISFGTLVTAGLSGIIASHIPMLIDRDQGSHGTLFGHLAKGNSQWKDSKPGEEGLAIFLGPDAYITPSWYESKKETGKVVPTWNYITVHVRGPVSFFEDAERLMDIVTKLTKHHEAYSKNPWQVADAPSDYIGRELKSIVGFEMEIARIEGKWKLSQNKPQGDRDGVRKGLAERGRPFDEAVSAEMNQGKMESEPNPPGSP